MKDAFTQIPAPLRKRILNELGYSAVASAITERLLENNEPFDVRPYAFTRFDRAQEMSRFWWATYHTGSLLFMDISSQDIYRIVFKDYPDILNVKQVSDLLGISTKTVYKLIKSGSLSCLKAGREFRIPKVTLMQYMKVLSVSD